MKMKIKRRITDLHSAEAASLAALRFCELNKGWKRICDLGYDSGRLYQTWDHLSGKEQQYWLTQYGEVGAKSAWEEMGTKKCLVPMLLIDGTGFTYQSITHVPPLVNTMTIYAVE